MSSGLPPSQGYKQSGEGHAGGGPDATRSQNTSTTYPGQSRENQSGPAQDVAGTLPTNFSLGQTKAESKGEDRQPIYSHDIDDVLPHAPHAQPQANGRSAPLHTKAAGPN